ncbi:CopD family protein [Mesorhizobium sp. CO1-1-8]|uniref:CopD family protein n=1 Tax=Mesorhizobium sp. CO1-1-8 TaxID=2876631 RepID=UPI001CD062A8|nr:CopD family protein [Mesorhizobium sp. CO1-1-8]MBZ9772563.1 CopD family protein [Mesorhizobium sp. CO1-1-8]
MEFYPYLVAAHVTAVIFLVGGLMAHNRIVDAIARRQPEQQGGALAVLLQFDSRVTTPALLFTWALGLSLAVWGQWFPSLWLIVKLVFVVGLSALHGIQSGRLRRAIRDGTAVVGLPGTGAGIIIATLAIATLALVKPF